MLMRPDLFDPHSVHFHGFPNAAQRCSTACRRASITINMGFSLTYYYKIVEPGTFMYHCHVEAAEHMQMGMLGNLYVRPKQNGDVDLGGPSNEVRLQRRRRLDRLRRRGSDPDRLVRPQLPHRSTSACSRCRSRNMHDDYPMLNGRGYPDTVDTRHRFTAGASEKVDVGVQ